MPYLQHEHIQLHIKTEEKSSSRKQQRIRITHLQFSFMNCQRVGLCLYNVLLILCRLLFVKRSLPNLHMHMHMRSWLKTPQMKSHKPTITLVCITIIKLTMLHLCFLIVPLNLNHISLLWNSYPVNPTASYDVSCSLVLYLKL